MNLVEQIAKISGILICLFFIVFPELPVSLEYSLFGLILITVGIPHGGIDHLIHNPEIDKRGLIRFISVYLALIFSYGLIWWVFPKLALVAFLMMSAYHFGQSHYLLKSIPKKLIFLTMFSKGCFFLFVILFGSWEMTQSIISSIVDLDIYKTNQLTILLFLFLGYLATQVISEVKLTIENLLEYLILAPILYFSPLLISFIVYFGFWHALPSMAEEFRFLKSRPSFNSFKKFGIQLIPFSLLSLLGIAILMVLGLRYLEESQLFLYFSCLFPSFLFHIYFTWMLF